MPKRVSLPSMLPPDCSALTPSGRHAATRTADCRPAPPRSRRQHATTNAIVIAASTRVALPPVADHAAEHEAQRRRNQEDRQHLHEVGERRRVLVRMRRVGVEEAAAVGAEHLDRFLRGDRAHRDRLLVGLVVLHHRVALGVLDGVALGIDLRRLVGRHLQRRHVLVRLEVLDHALADEDERDDDRRAAASTYSVMRVRSTQKLPMVAAVWRAKPRISAIDDGDAGGGREEVLHGERRASASDSSSSLRRVALPVGVGDEADRGVERGVGRHRAEALRIAPAATAAGAATRRRTSTPSALNASTASA